MRVEFQPDLAVYMAFYWVPAIGRCLLFDGTIEKTGASLLIHTMSTTLTVSGMTCGHCEQSVEDALDDIDSVLIEAFGRGAC